jgi:hypothetical protein
MAPLKAAAAAARKARSCQYWQQINLQQVSLAMQMLPPAWRATTVLVVGHHQQAATLQICGIRIGSSNASSIAACSSIAGAMNPDVWWIQLLAG